MIINYITLYMSYIYVYVYIHIIFFPNESVVRYFPSQYWLRGIYIKRDVTVQSSTCEGPEAQSRAQGREGCPFLQPREGGTFRALQGVLEGFMENAAP